MRVVLAVPIAAFLGGMSTMRRLRKRETTALEEEVIALREKATLIKEQIKSLKSDDKHILQS